MKNIEFPLLDQINFPADLRKINLTQLPQLCEELRAFIVDTVSLNGGHFGASLGVVELTAALHYVMNTPYDQLVWDVGHQAYGHKILTGRKSSFHTNRKYKGLSGFPRRTESEYDTFGTGHSSTSISAALGMALAAKHKGQHDKQHIAVIGDGAMTAGLAFEALNHAGISNTNLIVILNDNCMSIDPNVGALKEYLTHLTLSKTYNKIRQKVGHTLDKIPVVGEISKDILNHAKAGLKSALAEHANFFEALNMRYFGPVDGHDVLKLADMLKDLKHIPGPKLLHVVTTKGKGFLPAEEEKTLWHFPGLFDKVTGKIHKKPSAEPQPPKYQDVFGHSIIELAELNDKIVGITPAMLSGSSLKLMMEKMPERTFDVGICEQHAVTLSAGLATQGLKVFCNIYSSFMQRGYDQLIHDVVLQKLPVIFCLDRGGLVGEDGATHHGIYDIAYSRCLPDVIISSPMNESELRNLMYTAQLDRIEQPFIIRYPRGQGVMPNWRTPVKEIEIGTGRTIREGTDIAILTFGHPGNFASDACSQLEKEGINPGLFDMRFVKPLDKKLLHHIFNKYAHVITVEDGCRIGGLGSAIAEFMAEHKYQASIQILGVPDCIVEHGKVDELYMECAYDKQGIIAAVREALGEKVLTTKLWNHESF
ncbi:1-deoxy-D-xylulose-5-phosphate synthase [Pedobacter cryoconitis]|uniref:1-deoxy-D-xylulose-5-phosphate synthase n=1 Tax=Pedobacter cryoconitis TaxID=188932 RepID=A0A7X0J5J5_9SPHI|nr:1-deoxy-D-xylulose-5-phosphate synthase [Pedobacter cryoconitis]MBB6501255.1 1-deoxy-D-xylulose-5-phosphate synthase [Pedobacter cryoconitis]